MPGTCMHYVAILLTLMYIKIKIRISLTSYPELFFMLISYIYIYLKIAWSSGPPFHIRYLSVPCRIAWMFRVRSQFVT